MSKLILLLIDCLAIYLAITDRLSYDCLKYFAIMISAIEIIRLFFINDSSESVSNASRMDGSGGGGCSIPKVVIDNKNSVELGRSFFDTSITNPRIKITDSSKLGVINSSGGTGYANASESFNNDTGTKPN
jgi:hypothetical protein